MFTILKRILDIVISLMMLVLLLPVMLFIFIFISIDSGPVFSVFSQKRIGKNGRSFSVYKFRTLTLSHSNQLKIGHEIADLTKIGRLLRKYSLDELPQLINVLIGDMSLVGPRPLPVEYYTYIKKKYSERNTVKPGLVCFTHLYGGNSLEWKDRLQLDILYVKTCSLLTDLYILSKVPLIIIKGQGDILSSNLIKG